MTRHLLLLLGLILLLPLPLWATTDDVEQSLRRDYPTLEFQQITPGPFDGAYQVVVNQGDILYYLPQQGFLITGEIWTRDAQNLTRNAQTELMTQKAGLFPLDKALIIGNGPHQVIEVVDPDCPYCREGSAFFTGRKDVTRYIYLFPLDIHPQAEAKAAFILSAKDPQVAYEDVMGGAYDNQELPPFKDNGRLKIHQELGLKLGIHGTPKYWIDGRFVAGSNLKLAEKMLSGKQD
ncbi:MAG: DsbC family protein [Geopsychrobacter sp.]|nr:DsbC family protein [Geopsychrobacter sp.]